MITMMFKKCRDSIKYVVTLANIQGAKEASHHLNLMVSCQTFYSHVCICVYGSLELLVVAAAYVQEKCNTFYFDGAIGGDYF